MTIKEKLLKIATTIYGASDVEYSPEAEEQIARYTALGFGSLPVCVAKTHLSLSADAKLKGVPTNFVLPVREVRASVGVLPTSCLLPPHRRVHLRRRRGQAVLGDLLHLSPPCPASCTCPAPPRPGALYLAHPRSTAPIAPKVAALWRGHGAWSPLYE